MDLDILKTLFHDLTCFSFLLAVKLQHHLRLTLVYQILKTYFWIFLNFVHLNLLFILDYLDLKLIHTHKNTFGIAQLLFSVTSSAETFWGNSDMVLSTESVESVVTLRGRWRSGMTGIDLQPTVGSENLIFSVSQVRFHCRHCRWVGLIQTIYGTECVTQLPVLIDTDERQTDPDCMKEISQRASASHTEGFEDFWTGYWMLNCTVSFLWWTPLYSYRAGYSGRWW